jgi:hypothetical protein
LTVKAAVRLLLLSVRHNIPVFTVLNGRMSQLQFPPAQFLPAIFSKTLLSPRVHGPHSQGRHLLNIRYLCREYSGLPVASGGVPAARRSLPRCPATPLSRVGHLPGQRGGSTLPASIRPYTPYHLACDARRGLQSLDRKPRMLSEIFCGIFSFSERSRRWPRGHGGIILQPSRRK